MSLGLSSGTFLLRKQEKLQRWRETRTLLIEAFWRHPGGRPHQKQGGGVGVERIHDPTLDPMCLGTEREGYGKIWLRL